MRVATQRVNGFGAQRVVDIGTGFRHAAAGLGRSRVRLLPVPVDGLRDPHRTWGSPEPSPHCDPTDDKDRHECRAESEDLANSVAALGLSTLSVVQRPCSVDAATSLLTPLIRRLRCRPR